MSKAKAAILNWKDKTHQRLACTSLETARKYKPVSYRLDKEEHIRLVRHIKQLKRELHRCKHLKRRKKLIELLARCKYRLEYIGSRYYADSN